MDIELRRYVMVTVLLVACAGLSLAQKASRNGDKAPEKGDVFVDVFPEEAYIWVDGKPASHRSSMLKLDMGEHIIDVYNYGYFPKTRKVRVTGAYQEVAAHLEPVPGTVKGPWGKIQIEGVPGDSLVLMNGTSRDFFVGHADEMNNDFWTKQALVAPVGTHQLTIINRKTNQPIWSGQLEVRENKRLILYVRGDRKADVVYKNWSNGKKINELRRFEAGTASAIVAVAPVTGKLAVDRQEVKCNEPVKLSWNSTDAAVAAVTANDKKLADGANGDLELRPRETTKYTLHAAGPGGTVVREADVAVDPKVDASLTSSTQELRYVKVGDKVQEQSSADLQWSAANADSVTLDPGGPLNGSSGTRTVQVSPPRQAHPGPLDETETYRLVATNVCGGSETKTVSFHVTGSIQPEEVAQVQPEPEPELPATASPLPFLAAVGFASLGLGLFLKSMKRKRQSGFESLAGQVTNTLQK